VSHRRAIARGGAAAWAPPANLVAWWYADDTTDGKWTDRSGHGWHATLVGTPTLGATGLTLNGTSQRATVGLWDAGATELTLCGWAHPARTTGNGMGVMSAHQGSYIRAWLGLGGNGMAPNALYAFTWPGTSLDVYRETGTRTAGQWVHLAATYKSSHYQCYVNGSPAAAEFTTQALPGDNTTVWRIGDGWVDGNKYWRGTLTDIMAFSRAVAAAEIADIYANSPGRPI
jgi:hypothetical protein